MTTEWGLHYAQIGTLVGLFMLHVYLAGPSQLQAMNCSRAEVLNRSSILAVEDREFCCQV
jgi:hypothetical protein